MAGSDPAFYFQSFGGKIVRIVEVPKAILNVWRHRKTLAPVIRFNHKLYKELVRKCSTSVVDAHEDDPEVKFHYGPIDGVLGHFDVMTKEIHVDLLEIMVITLDDHRVVTYDDFGRQYDVTITRVLAHEGGHWHLDRRLGMWPVVERALIYIVLTLIGLAMTLGVCYLSFVTLSSSIYTTTELLPWPLLFLLRGIFIGVLIWLELKVFKLLFLIGKTLSAAVTYQLCYHERFARKFEGNVHTEEKWSEVVVVEMS